MHRLKTISLSSDNSKSDNRSHYLLVPPQNPKLFRQKLQIEVIPGVLPKERNRYRVVLGDEVLGDYLSLDEALTLAKGES